MALESLAATEKKGAETSRSSSRRSNNCFAWLDRVTCRARYKLLLAMTRVARAESTRHIRRVKLDDRCSCYLFSLWSIVARVACASCVKTLLHGLCPGLVGVDEISDTRREQSRARKLAISMPGTRWHNATRWFAISESLFAFVGSIVRSPRGLTLRDFHLALATNSHRHLGKVCAAKLKFNELPEHKSQVAWERGDWTVG